MNAKKINNHKKISDFFDCKKKIKFDVFTYLQNTRSHWNCRDKKWCSSKNWTCLECRTKPNDPDSGSIDKAEVHDEEGRNRFVVKKFENLVNHSEKLKTVNVVRACGVSIKKTKLMNILRKNIRMVLLSAVILTIEKRRVRPCIKDPYLWVIKCRIGKKTTVLLG